MVIQNFSRPIIPLRKCDLFGLGQMGAAGIQGAINAAIAAQTNLTNERIAQSANSTNLRLNQATNEANIAINDATNQMNKQLADEANEFNYKMFVEQNDWNEMMWNKQNSYNDPSAQMQRLVAAGINPNLLGGNTTTPGNATELPSSASMPQAQVATFNPVQLQSGHVDPYKLLPFEADWLGPVAQAAGIAKTQAETEGQKLGNDFDASTFKTREDMEKGQLDYLLKRLEALNQDILFKGSANKRELQRMDLYNGYLRLSNKNIEEEMNRRKEEFKEWSEMAPVRKKQLVATLFHTIADINHMSADELHMKAQEQHWNVQDQLSKDQVEVLRQGMKLKLVDQILGTAKFRPTTRQAIGEALSKAGYTTEGQILQDFNAAADGNYNNFLGEFLHTRTGSRVEAAIDVYLDNFLKSQGIIYEDDQLVPGTPGGVVR